MQAALHWLPVCVTFKIIILARASVVSTAPAYIMEFSVPVSSQLGPLHFAACGD